MSDLINHKTRTLRFYACGGTAANLLNSHINDQPLLTDVRADELYTFVDTGTANLNGVSPDNVFLVKNPDGKEGSGKDRRRNAANIMAALPEIMRDHKAADMNVVIFSTGGGSGSAAGPIIMEELLKQGKTVFPIVVGIHSSDKSSENTIKTFVGLQGIVDRIGRPINVSYRQNDPAKNYADNNTVHLFVMSAISIFCSGKNAHLDPSDVDHFFDFHKVTNTKPALAMLDVFCDEKQLIKDVPRPITFAALMKSHDEVVPAINPGYDTVGFLPEEAAMRYNQSFYFTTSIDRLKNVLTDLNEREAELASAKRVEEKQVRIGGNDIDVDPATGLVF